MLSRIMKIFRSDESDGPVETGGINSLSLEQVMKRYLAKPNDLLKILRIYRNIEINDLSNKSSFSADQIVSFEEGESVVPYQFLCDIAVIYGVDLKLLLCCFGLAKWEDVGGGAEEEFPLAARYSGKELSKEERVDLTKLFKLIIQNRSKK